MSCSGRGARRKAEEAWLRPGGAAEEEGDCAPHPAGHSRSRALSDRQHSEDTFKDKAFPWESHLTVYKIFLFFSFGAGNKTPGLTHASQELCRRATLPAPGTLHNKGWEGKSRPLAEGARPGPSRQALATHPLVPTDRPRQ